MTEQRGEEQARRADAPAHEDDLAGVLVAQEENQREELGPVDAAVDKVAAHDDVKGLVGELKIFAQHGAAAVCGGHFAQRNQLAQHRVQRAVHVAKDGHARALWQHHLLQKGVVGDRQGDRKGQIVVRRGGLLRNDEKVDKVRRCEDAAIKSVIAAKLGVLLLDCKEKQASTRGRAEALPWPRASRRRGAGARGKGKEKENKLTALCLLIDELCKVRRRLQPVSQRRRGNAFCDAHARRRGLAGAAQRARCGGGAHGSDTHESQRQQARERRAHRRQGADGNGGARKADISI